VKATWKICPKTLPFLLQLHSNPSSHTSSRKVDSPKISLGLPVVDSSDAYDRVKGVKSKPQTVHGSHVEHLWLQFPKGYVYADDEFTVKLKDSHDAITDFLKAKYVNQSTKSEQALLCPSQGPFKCAPVETGEVLVINALGHTVATLPRNIIEFDDTELPPLEDIQPP
jgi:hypothetical protein